MEDLIYSAKIDVEGSEEQTGIDAIAFTKSPAILIKGMAFKEEAKKELLFADNKKYRIVAPAMLPAQIYRSDEDGEYYVEFTEQEIERIHQKFMQNLDNTRANFNEEHNNNKKVPAYILEAWLVDNPKEDKAYTTYGLEVPKGTLILTTQITDKDYYKKLVEEGQIGYSIEGFFGLELQLNKSQKMAEKLMLPDGEWEINGMVYVVEGGEIKEILEKEEIEEIEAGADYDKKKEEEMGIDVMPNAKLAPNPGQVSEEKEEKMMEDPESPSSDKGDMKFQVSEEEIMKIVQPKLDEIYGVIADLKNLVEGQVDTMKAEDQTEKMEMNIHNRFQKVMGFISNK
jgi:hypothetical protein